MTIAAIYAEFAAREARGVSPAYERLASAVTRDHELLASLAALPQPLALLEVGASAGLCLYASCPTASPAPAPRAAA
jgi:hypothetical protein